MKKIALMQSAVHFSHRAVKGDDAGTLKDDAVTGKRLFIFWNGNNHPYLSTLFSIGAGGSPAIWYRGEHSSLLFVTALLQKLFARDAHTAGAGNTMPGLLQAFARTAQKKHTPFLNIFILSLSSS